MNDQKKRGSKYTATDKEILLELVKNYQNIIENKCSNGQIIQKKRQTWELICHKYNAVSVSGSRTWQQLRHLYENLKQKTKKNMALANRLQFYEKTKEIQKKASLDKKEIGRTGGGTFKTTLSDQDAQILAMVAPQVQPLSNPYDDAALYFGDIQEEVTEARSSVGIDPEVMIITTISGDKQKEDAKVRSSVGIDPEVMIIHTSNEKDYPEATVATMHTENHPQTSTTVRPSIKQQYFNQKLKNAKLEYKQSINKHKLEMQLLRLKIQQVKSSCEQQVHSNK